MYSFSGLSTTLSSSKYGCWHKFYCRYVLNLPSRPGLPLIFGKACHAIIETAIKTKNSHVIPFLCQAVASVNELDTEELLECVDIPPVQKAVQTGGGVEEYFEMELDDSPFPPVLRGYIDFNQKTDKAVILTDWKSNRAAYKPLETYQLGLYAAYLNKKYSLPVIGRLVFLRFNTIEEHEYTDADIEEAIGWARDTAYECEARKQKIEMGEDPLNVFPKQPGDACEYCDYKYYCLSEIPAIPEVISSKEEALEVARGIMFAKENLKLHQDRLKDFISKNGPVQNDLVKAVMEKSEYLVFSLKARLAVVKKMQQDGLNVGGILKIGSDAQKDLREKHGWSEKDFLDLGAVKRSKNNLDISKAG
ncbi:MAG TPA: hypothetical protein DDZ91_12075 [Firmicutes bacterium]|jgi:CRISPR/Cas system-associated exonuclease Cas4 (RecB family)|nr:hypothetical protein [Bacillota bacterium]